MASGPPLLGIVGWKNSGKTTLVERLIPLLRQRGLKVATVKHSHHTLRTRDGETDGERHARAGATATLVLGADTWEMNGELQHGPAPEFDDLQARLRDADLILVEGFKSAAIPKIEVRRFQSATDGSLAAHDPSIIAVVADPCADAGSLPTFHLDDVEAVADFIATFVALPAPGA